METNFEIKVGDRVGCIIDEEGRGFLIGKVGTVVKTFTYNSEPHACIEFDENIYGHNCDGFAKRGHGWNLPIAYLILFKNKILTVKQWKQNLK